jgi:hypothetical protein
LAESTFGVLKVAYREEIESALKRDCCDYALAIGKLRIPPGLFSIVGFLAFLWHIELEDPSMARSTSYFE